MWKRDGKFKSNLKSIQIRYYRRYREKVQWTIVWTRSMETEECWKYSYIEVANEILENPCQWIFYEFFSLSTTNYIPFDEHPFILQSQSTVSMCWTYENSIRELHSSPENPMLLCPTREDYEQNSSKNCVSSWEFEIFLDFRVSNFSFQHFQQTAAKKWEKSCPF